MEVNEAEELSRDQVSPSPNPVLASNLCNVVNFNWVDVTEDFTNAIKDLELGELLHDENFGLFEAMSAIEMMDPKMDAGMRCNRGNKPPLTFRQAVERDLLRLQGIPYCDQIAIIDTTWACMVSWLDGHSLAQTVFTNLYLHNPHCIIERPLKAFCIAIFKIIDIIRDFINRGLVFEEEDFQLLMYGYRLVPDVSEIRSIGMLKEVEDELLRKNKGAPIDEETNAVITRLKFTRLLLQAFVILNRKEVIPASVAEASKLLAVCSELIPTICKNCVEVEEGVNVMGFDPMVNQRLLPPTFPRYTHIKSPAAAYGRVDELLGRLRLVSRIASLTSFHAALEHMLEVSCSKPCIVSRSVMQLLLLPQCPRTGDSIGCADALRDAARAFICPPALAPRSPLGAARDAVDGFFALCVRPFSALVQLCGLNRARQRDKLGNLLEDFANLQDEAERVDLFLHNLSKKVESSRSHLACFGTWILYHTLRIMIMYLLSGFELELYSTHEYHYIYWYLFEFLYPWVVSALSRADTFILEYESEKKKKAKSKQKKRGKMYAKEITQYQAMQHMCGGYYKAMVALRIQGKLRLPHPEFDSERVRYEHRFSVFSTLATPPLMQYNEFADMTASFARGDPAAQYLAGCKHFHQAWTLLDAIPPTHDIPALIKVAKTNFIVLKLLASGHKSDSNVPPHFDFSLHHHFPVIKIT